MYTKIIGMDDIENLNYLAEEVLIQLSFIHWNFALTGNICQSCLFLENIF